ncbi:hypothetical protein JCM6882_007448 [Rhodosporidiobolus microsporus]
MEILSEAESRSFSQFLDSFSSSTTTPAPEPNAFLPSYGQHARAPYGAEKLAGMSRIGPAGGAAPLGGWAAPAPGGGGGGGGYSGRGDSRSRERRYGSAGNADAATAQAMSGFGYGAAQLPPPPLPPSLPPSYPPSFAPPPGADAFIPQPSGLPTHPHASTSRHHLYSAPAASTSSSFPPPSLAYPTASTSSSSYPTSYPYPHYPKPPPLSPNTQAEQKRVRMAHQAEELQAMMHASGSGTAPAGPSRSLSRGRVDYRGEAGDVQNGIEEEDEEGSPPLKRTKSGDEGAARRQPNPIALMLEAEQRVGFHSSTTASRLQQHSAFAAPPRPPPPASTSSAEAQPSPPSRPAPKRKAAAPRKSAARASSKTASSAAIKPEDGASPVVDSSSAPLFPFATPSNIPLARRRTSRPPVSHRTAKPSTSNTSPPPPLAATTNGTKPALLTAAQKKANHIASEQKRRAAIRAGYDGLCTVVPSLRAAVEEYEERLAAVSGAKGGKRGKAGRGRGGESTTGALMGGIEVGGEKVDGRAGPKSEAVVLGKTVEHLRLLLTNRQTLLTRLSSLHSTASAQSIPLSPPTSAGYPGAGAKQVAGAWDKPWEEGWMKGEVMQVLGLAMPAEEEEVKEEEGSEDEVDEDVPGA